MAAEILVNRLDPDAAAAADVGFGHWFVCFWS